MTTYDGLHGGILAGVADRTVPQWAASVLYEVAAGRSPVAAVRHPLGFLCFPLERTADHGVCVHVWTDRLVQARPTTTTMHSHSWDLISFVLYGTLCNELVDVSDAPASSSHRVPYRVFEVASGRGGDEVRRTGRLVHRRTVASELHHRGDVYTLPAGSFHRTTPHGEVATVALGRGRQGGADLVLGAAGIETHRMRRQVCDRDETMRAASLVVEQLTGLGGPRDRQGACESGLP